MNVNIPIAFINNTNTQSINNSNNSEGFENLMGEEFKEIFELLGSSEENNVEIEEEVYALIQSLFNSVSINDENQQKNFQGNTLLDYNSVMSISKEELLGFIDEQNGIQGELKEELKHFVLGNKSDNKIQELLQKIEVKLNEINSNVNTDLKKLTPDENKVVIRESTDFIESPYEQNTLTKTSNLQINSHIEDSLLTVSNGNRINVNEAIKTEDEDIGILQDIINNNEQNYNFKPSSELSLKNIASESSPIRYIKQESMSQDIIKVIKYLKVENLEEIKVSINPKELGEMTIKLIKESNEAKILITISKDDTYNLVNKNLQDISKHLNEANIRVREIGVEVKAENQNNFSENFNREFNQNKKDRRNRHRSQIAEIEEIHYEAEESENINILI